VVLDLAIERRFAVSNPADDAEFLMDPQPGNAASGKQEMGQFRDIGKDRPPGSTPSDQSGYKGMW
jgi:hypothetical protein